MPQLSLPFDAPAIADPPSLGWTSPAVFSFRIGTDIVSCDWKPEPARSTGGSLSCRSEIFLETRTHVAGTWGMFVRGGQGRSDDLRKFAAEAVAGEIGRRAKIPVDGQRVGE